MGVLSIAALQMAPVIGDRGATLQRVRRKVLTVARDFPHVRLVVLPELLLCAEAPFGEANSGPSPAKLAEPLPGPTTDVLAGLAREARVWLVPGSLYERAGDRVYNSVPVINPDGRMVTVYRKIFPWYPFEPSHPGTEFVVFDLDGIATVGLAVCFDGTFPETFRQLAWLGAEVILQPTLTSTRDRTQELVVAQANSIVNQLWTVNVNGASPAGVGESLIVDPEGIIRQRAGNGEEILVEQLDIQAVQRARRYGAAGTTRPWALIAQRDEPVALPAYGGELSCPDWANDLKDSAGDTGARIEETGN